MKGLAELKNKVVKAPHLNIFKIGTWVTMGLFATYLLIYIFVGQEMLNYFPLLILFAFATPFISYSYSYCFWYTFCIFNAVKSEC